MYLVYNIRELSRREPNKIVILTAIHPSRLECHKQKDSTHDTFG